MEYLAHISAKPKSCPQKSQLGSGLLGDQFRILRHSFSSFCWPICFSIFNDAIIALRCNPITFPLQTYVDNWNWISMNVNTGVNCFDATTNSGRQIWCLKSKISQESLPNQFVTDHLIPIVVLLWHSMLTHFRTFLTVLSTHSINWLNSNLIFCFRKFWHCEKI